MLRTHAMRSLTLFASMTLTALGCVSEPAEDSASSEAENLTPGACAGAAEWAPNVSYARGALVRYQGKVYRCIQSHTSLSVWTPDVVPALWKATSCSGTGTSTGSGNHGGGSTGSGGNSGSGGSGGGGAGGGTGGAGGGSTGSGGGGQGATEYAPYFYTWGWGNSAYPFTGLVDLKSRSGLGAVTLAFVLSNGGCAATRDIQDHKADLDAFRARGGAVKASFGGANGTYLENACGDEGSLAQAISGFVSETGITDLDFDVEQGGAMTADINQKRAKALKAVQDQTGVKVAFTLAAFPRDKWGTPGGMTAASLDVVTAAVRAGVRISHVNLMVMDYGSYYSAGKTMGELAESALTDANAELRANIPGLTEAQGWAMLGATPMIGQNDVSTEIFTLDDARTLTAFARQNRLGLVAFWAINRDQPCPYDDLGVCSKAESAAFAFHNIFKGVQ